MNKVQTLKIEFLVDAGSFWDRFREDLRHAREYAWVQTMSYEGDPTGQMFGQALIDSPARDKRLIADDFYVRGKISDKWLRSPRNLFNREVRRERAAAFELFDRMRKAGIGVVLRNPGGVWHQNFFSRNHKKIFIADNVSYLGGINISDHNFAWHDMMVRFEDPQITEFLRSDFASSFEGRDENTPRTFGPVEIHRLDGRSNRKAFQPIFDLIAGARESVYVLSPYITFPFYEKLRAAQANGARVTIVTPSCNNWRSFQTYTEWEAVKAGMDLRMYTTRMSHLKAILVDDNHLIVGSSNFDKLSVKFMQEIVAVISDPAAIASFKSVVLTPDLEQSTPKYDSISSLIVWFNISKFRLLIWVYSGYQALARLWRS
jgi:cardiolipin synthase